MIVSSNTVRRVNEMAEEFPQSRILSVSRLVQAYQGGCDYGEHFCFILGSGASVDSGIPMGGTLENEWMKYLMGEGADRYDAHLADPRNPRETREAAANLLREGRMQHKFAEIEAAWEQVKQNGGCLSSDYYSDLYTLRFYPSHRNGYYYLEELMADKEPSFGYHPLAKLLTDGRGNNLVITTNFDSLVEDALFLYSSKKPLVINHEQMAGYVAGHNLQRPIVAKVHRGMFFDPLNEPRDIDGLKPEWREVLQKVFDSYTPIVIGYGGGDHSLMDFLNEDSTRLPNGIYWCYVERFGLPGENIQKLVERNDGHLVRIHSFDHVMLQLGSASFQDSLFPNKTAQYLTARNSRRIETYMKQFDELQKEIGDSPGEEPSKPNKAEVEQKKQENSPDISASSAEFRKAVSDLVTDDKKSTERRRKANQKTVWDYLREGNRLYDEKKFNQAVEAYTKAIELNPEYATSYNNRGFTYKNLKEFDKALADLNRAIDLNPDYVNAYYNLGNTYKALGDYDKALADYSRAIELNPDYVNAYNNRGFTYNNLKEYDKALADLNRAIELNPDFVEAYNNRGFAYHNLKEFDKALADFDRAIELDFGCAIAYHNRAEVYRALGQEDKAAADEAMYEKLTKAE